MQVKQEAPSLLLYVKITYSTPFILIIPLAGLSRGLIYKHFVACVNHNSSISTFSFTKDINQLKNLISNSTQYFISALSLSP